MSLSKYDDPNNPIDKRKGHCNSKIQCRRWTDSTLSEKTSSGETLMTTLDADGSQRFEWQYLHNLL